MDMTIRTVRVSLVLLALTLGVVVARPASADDRSIDVQVDRFKSTCNEGGGTLDESHYEFDVDGSVRWAVVRCKGGDYDNWQCSFHESESICSRVFDPGTGGWSVAVGGGPVAGVKDTAPDPTVEQTVVYWDSESVGVLEAPTDPAASATATVDEQQIAGVAETPGAEAAPEDETSQVATKIRYRIDDEDERP
jgi:hypothetical protein